MRGSFFFVTGFGVWVLFALGIIPMRGQVVREGNKIIKLQKRLWEAKDLNDKLKNTYRKMVTPENIVRKNRELNLSLVPPSRVIRIREGEMVSMKDGGKKEEKAVTNKMRDGD